MLEIRNVKKSFGGIRAVDGVSFEVNPGRIKAIIGPNGAGKTTLFNLISGLYPLDSGEIRFKGRRISGLKPHRIASMGIVRTFQNVRLFPEMTVLENVMVGAHRLGKSGFLASIFKLPGTVREERRIREIAMEMLEFVGLADQADLPAGELPLGRQRLVELARALAARPELLLLDEPAAGLNIKETEELGELIVRIRERGVTIALIDHDMSLVMDISDEVVALNEGRKIAEGTPEEIRSNPLVIKAYLGEEGL
ncbi:high-affinity branched-chain amino acid ABC transporter ATP-binding protein LivG [Candidatus Poribacteria bacterium]|nr:MAG: high-affinity branched-chain amino acid ABC transporter ATP-binding protein LivG [Candidatus Poribacteria bacterium]